MSATAARSPYVGLAAYREDEAALFFGRAREIRVVTANVLTTPVSVLYGAPGVGKSSLVRAGLAARLRARADQAVVVFEAWQTDPLIGLKQGLAGELTRLSRGLAPEAVNLDLDAFLEQGALDLPVPIVLILDQFEDYLVHTRPSELTRSFEEQFARAANRRDLAVHFLLVLRDDVLARLDRLSGRIPVVFNNRLQLERLSWDAAREAITEPLRVYNEQNPDQPPVRIEPELVDAIVEQVRASDAVRLTRLARPAGSVTAQDEERQRLRVEAPFLQLVLARLWAEEIGRGSRLLRAATLESLGGAARILQQHFDLAMTKLASDQREIVARVFRFLVSPSGMTHAYSAAELASYAEVPLDEVEPVLSQLAQADAGILRPVAAPEGDDAASQQYEVAFDILARAALVWRARFIALGSYRGHEVGRALAAVAVTVALAEALIQPPSPILLGTRGLAILVPSSLVLVQIYRWFLRYVSMTGFLSIRAYRSPFIGVALAALLTTFWYSSTKFTANGLDWLGRLDRLGFAMYLFTILITWAVGAFAFISMQLVGQLTAARLRSFDAGLYTTFALWSLLILVAILLVVTAALPRWIELPSARLVG